MGRVATIASLAIVVAAYCAAAAAQQSAQLFGRAPIDASYQWDRVYGDCAGCGPEGCGGEDYGPCGYTCGPNGGCPPLWATSGGVRFIARNRTRDAVVSTDAAIVPVLTAGGISQQLGTKPAIAGHNITFNPAPAMALQIERYLGRDVHNHDWYLQGNYWGLNNYVGSQTLRTGLFVTDRVSETTILRHGGLNTTAFGGAVPGVDWADVQSFHYNSGFNNVELNLHLVPRSRGGPLVLYPDGQWHRESQEGPYWSFLVGLRYFRLDEFMELNSAGTVEVIEDDQIVNTGRLSGQYVIHTVNDMYGLTFGTDLMFRQNTWDWGVRAKFSPFINVAQQDADVRTDNTVLINQTIERSDRNTGVSGIVETGLVAHYKIGPVLAVEAAYDVGWLLGVAMAPEQANQPGLVNAHGNLFFHGLTLGLKFSR